MLDQPQLSIKGYFRSTSKKLIAYSVFFAAMRVGFSIAWPYLLFQQLFNKEDFKVETMYWVIPVVIVMFGLSQFAMYRQLLVNTKIINSSSLGLINELWEKMVSLEWLSFKSKNRAYYFDMFMVDSWRVRQGIMAILETILPYSIISVLLLLLVLYISLPIFVLYSVGFVLTAVMQLLSNHKLRPVIRMYHTAWRGQSNNVGISVDKFDQIRMNRGRKDAATKFDGDTSAFLETNSGLMIAQSRWKIIIQIVIQLTRIFVLIVGLYWIKLELITWAEFFFTIFVIGIIQTNLSQLPYAVHQLLESLESLKKINEFFRLTSEKPSPIIDNAETETINSVQVEGLSFGYKKNNSIFKNYKLSLEKGKIYLWLGENGCGKTTLSLLLLGLIQPPRGNLNLNGERISWDQWRGLRDRFAFIHQDAILFSSSIKDNITFGHENRDKAWKKVNSSWLSEILPSGANIAKRMIGERGEGLSGGEARRIVLIREWLRSAELIIFDEPLNHLDSHSIQQITKEIISLKKDAIVIIISHQRGFESAADEVWQIDSKNE